MEENIPTPEEAKEELARRQQLKNSLEPSQGLIPNLWNIEKNYTKGVLQGGAQALGDMGASIANFGISGAEKLTGNSYPKISHPQWFNSQPQSFSESLGHNIGNFVTPFLIPAGAGVKTAQGANKLYKLLSQGKNLSGFAKTAAGGAGGALMGAAENESSRGTGALLGGLGGAAGTAIPEIINFSNSLKSKNIATNIVNRLKNLKSSYGNTFQKTLNEAEQKGINNFLKPQSANIKLLKKSGDEELIYPLEKFNKNPSANTAHAAQSELGKYISELMLQPKGERKRDAIKEALTQSNND